MSVHLDKGSWFCKWREDGKERRKYFGRGQDAMTRAMELNAKINTQKSVARLSAKLAGAQLSQHRKRYDDQSVIIPEFIDRLMEEIDVPLRFKDIRKMIIDTIEIKSKGIPARLRYDVLVRDKYTCQACGATAPEARLHVDHKIPISRGGITESRNLTTLCQICNLGKSDSPAHANMKF